MRISLAISLLSVLAVAPAAADVTVTLNPDKDNTLCQYGDSSNALGDIYAGRTGQADTDSRRRGAIHFNVAGSVPAGATITSAKLRLYLNQASDANSHTLSLRKASASWGEGTSFFAGGRCAAKTTNDASWTYRFYSATTWTSTGGDFSGTSTQTCSVGSTLQYYEWLSSSAMIADVQGWLTTSSTNYGWVVLGNEAQSATARRFTSREGTSTQLPQLVITYTTGALRASSPLAAASAAAPAEPRPDLPAGLRYLATRDLDGDGELDVLARDERNEQLVGIGRGGAVWVIEPETDADAQPAP
jgi:hypothetical protein